MEVLVKLCNEGVYLPWQILSEEPKEYFGKTADGHSYPIDGIHDCTNDYCPARRPNSWKET